MTLGFTVNGLLPLRFLESEDVRAVFRAVAPRLDLPSHQTVGRILNELDQKVMKARAFGVLVPASCVRARRALFPRGPCPRLCVAGVLLHGGAHIGV